MPNVDLDYKVIRKRVDAQLKREKRLVRSIFFVVNLLMYIFFAIMSWGLFLANQSAIPPVFGEDNPFLGAMILLTVAGGMGVLFQFISLMLETKAGEASMRQRTVARVMSEELLRLGLEEEEEPQEKEKRMMRLSDDGELEEVVDDAALSDEEIRTMSSGRR